MDKQSKNIPTQSHKGTFSRKLTQQRYVASEDRNVIIPGLQSGGKRGQSGGASR